MKHLLLLFTVLMALNACSKDDDHASLPPETQTGANTVGCLVNGKVYLPSKRGLNSPVNCFYQFIEGEFYFTMSFADDIDFGPDVSVQTLRISLEAGKTYLLNMNPNDDGDYSGGGHI